MAASSRDFRAAFEFLEEERTSGASMARRLRDSLKAMWGRKAAVPFFPEEELSCLRGIDADAVALGTSEPPKVYKAPSDR